MAVAGLFLRLTSTFIRGVQLCASILILGIFSFFLAELARHNLSIATWIKAVEGMSGAAALYGIFAVILTCCLGGIAFFAFLAIVLDICFIGCFVAIAILTRGGAQSCSGFVNTPLGSGKTSNGGSSSLLSGSNTAYIPDLKLACKLEKAAFAVAIVNVALFMLSALLQLFLGKHHQKEKRFGPSPSNNYTSGSGKQPFWKRNKKNDTARDTELGVLGAGAVAAEKNHRKKNSSVRPSNDTAMTGSTAAAPEQFYGGQNHVSGPNTYRQDGGYPRGDTTAAAHNPGYPGQAVTSDLEHVPGVHHGGFPHNEPGAQGAYNQTTFGSTNF